MKTPAYEIRRNGIRKEFSAAKIGEKFECNGNIWIKRSSRTATGVWPACLPEWAYFRKNEVVYVE